MAPKRCRLLAGSYGPERLPARPDSDDADWYLPLHLQDPNAARGRIVAQIMAGADVVVAPTWLTHRRALLSLGETRRAAAWTSAAVTTAREAIEIGLERRSEALVDAAPDAPGHARPSVLLAASLPSLEATAGHETGRLLPRYAATERDYRDQAGILADAAPDLLLIEGQASADEARTAMLEAAQTGLPAWQVLRPAALRTEALAVWLERAHEYGIARILLPHTFGQLERLGLDGPAWGGAGVKPDDVADWLEAGATAMASLDGADPGAVEKLRNAIDDVEAVESERHRLAERRWTSHVALGAGMAPGGQAAWIGPGPDEPRPDGFVWSHIEPAALPTLPHGRFKLIVAGDATDLSLTDALEPGGVLVVQGAASPRDRERLRLLLFDDAAEPDLTVYRREA